MSDEERAGTEQQPDAEPEAMPMPRWVAPAIGLVLVAMAALAVYTGLRFRQNTLATNVARPKPQPARGGDGDGPPGEPEPGASLVYPGDNAPTASAPVAGHARTEIAGGGTGPITMVSRYWARRGMMIHAVPDDAMVYVNDLAIGEAKQFNKPDEVYDFPQPGSYTIRIVAPGYREQVYVVTAADNAKAELVTVEAKLAKE